MTNSCDHYWEPTEADERGQPVFRLNRQMGAKPISHVKCRYCGARTWFDEGQWLEIPAQPYPKPVST